MITSISGILVSATPLHAIIETGGFGYEVHIPVTTAERLPQPERDFFRLLVEKVTGVGPKMALSVLSKLSLATLKSAIVAGDVALLAKCPGIGKKTAERLVMELRDKLSPFDLSPAAGTPIGSSTVPVVVENKIRDAVMALVALGYKPADADKSVRQACVAIGPAASTEALIKKALG